MTFQKKNKRIFKTRKVTVTFNIFFNFIILLFYYFIILSIEQIENILSIVLNIVTEKNKKIYFNILNLK